MKDPHPPKSEPTGNDRKHVKIFENLWQTQNLFTSFQLLPILFGGRGTFNNVPLKTKGIHA